MLETQRWMSAVAVATWLSGLQRLLGCQVRCGYPNWFAHQPAARQGIYSALWGSVLSCNATSNSAFMRRCKHCPNVKRWCRGCLPTAGTFLDRAYTTLCLGHITTADGQAFSKQNCCSAVQVTGLDFAQDMLDDAERRQRDLRQQQPRWRGRHSIHWGQGDAMDLPFEDSSFDAACMGYGLRNVTNIPKALQVG